MDGCFNPGREPELSLPHACPRATLTRARLTFIRLPRAIQVQELDIEHLLVVDDPRVWSDRRKTAVVSSPARQPLATRSLPLC